MFVSNIYLVELWWRFTYVIISFSATFFVILYFPNIFLFLEIYPFAKFVNKILIATYVTELFHSIIGVSFSISSILIFPLFSFHVHSFFSTSLYSYQLRLLKTLWTYIFLVWAAVTFICYNLVLPQFFTFFTQWEVKEQVSVFQLQLNAKIYSYLIWINTVYNSFSCFLLIFIILIGLVFFFLHPSTIFFFFKYYRKLMSFLLTCILYFLTPPDFLLQVFLMFFSFVSCELMFLTFCFRIQQGRIPDSSIG